MSLIEENTTTKTEMPQGFYYSLVIAYLLTIIGFTTSFSTNAIAFIIAVALLFFADSTSAANAKKILYKNIAILFLGFLSIFTFAAGLTNLFTMPIDDISATSMVSGVVIQIVIYLIIFFLKISVIIDFIKFLNTYDY